MGSERDTMKPEKEVEEYVTMPVPKSLVPAVYALIAASQGNGSDVKPSQAPGAIPTTKQPDGTISDALLLRIWNESGKTLRKVMKYLASRPGEAVGADEVAREIYGSAKGHKLAGAMGAFGRRAKGRYEGKKPFTVKFNAEANRWEYTMAKEVAARIAKF
jgi:hypothetical protein